MLLFGVTVTVGISACGAGAPYCFASIVPTRSALLRPNPTFKGTRRGSYRVVRAAVAARPLTRRWGSCVIVLCLQLSSLRVFW